MICFVPLAAFGILAIFFPYVYAFMPVDETELCVCSFYKELSCDPDHYIILKGPSQYQILQGINITSFFVVNWIVLFLIVLMVCQIRHMNDETLIKRETVIIAGTWLVASFIQFVLFFVTQLKDCIQHNPISEVIQNTYVATYMCIILRDLCVLCTMMYFQIKVSRINLYYNRLLEAD